MKLKFNLEVESEHLCSEVISFFYMQFIFELLHLGIIDELESGDFFTFFVNIYIVGCSICPFHANLTDLSPPLVWNGTKKVAESQINERTETVRVGFE